MIEKFDTNSFLFREVEEITKKENGNENFRFYYKYLKQFLKKMMEAKE